MWPDPQEIADLVTFTEKILMEDFIFCAVNGVAGHWFGNENDTDSSYDL